MIRCIVRGVTKWFGPYMLLMYLVRSSSADTIVRPRVILRGVDVFGVRVGCRVV